MTRLDTASLIRRVLSARERTLLAASGQSSEVKRDRFPDMTSEDWATELAAIRAKVEQALRPEPEQPRPRREPRPLAHLLKEDYLDDEPKARKAPAPRPRPAPAAAPPPVPPPAPTAPAPRPAPITAPSGPARRVYAERVCDRRGCGKTFVPRGPRHIYCCQPAAALRPAPVASRPEAERRQCDRCTNTFVPKGPRHKFCSETCANLTSKARQRRKGGRSALGSERACKSCSRPPGASAARETDPLLLHLLAFASSMRAAIETFERQVRALVDTAAVDSGDSEGRNDGS